jgi:UDP-N-acetylmuramoyl-L-alanyl-D-glutamate--2,6-diaminopimelate ligase
MTLGALFQAAGFDLTRLASKERVVDVDVSGIAYDSRTVGGGEIFVALKGKRYNGTQFIDQALERGARAIISEEIISARDVPWIKVSDARETLAFLSAAFHGNPSHELLSVGVTGTNGKTTTTYLIESILEQAGMLCGRVSSVSHRIGDSEQRAERTTPEAPDLQEMLRHMVDRACQACVMEVSSHSLALKRVDKVNFSAAVFTNLTRDHLDFHGNMNAYFETKRSLFERLGKTVPAVINIDDLYGRKLLDSVNHPFTYAIDTPSDVMPERMDLSLDGIILSVRTPRGSLQLRSRLVGRINAYNILAAAATGAALAIPFQAIEKGIAAVEFIPGRMQLVSREIDDVTVLVDFAHTDDALRGLLEALRPFTRGRVITVFGCGGDRDQMKRPLMGSVAARLSDLVVLTSDNPRSEDPEKIIKDIESGLVSKMDSTSWTTLLDRTEAITTAIHDARAGDLVVIAGKGHECYQQIGQSLVPFDDSEVAREALVTRRSALRV